MWSTGRPEGHHAGDMVQIKVSVQAEPKDLGSWLALAMRLEAGGFHALLMGDHPGSGTSPWPALGAAAAVTGNLRLGTYVVQAGVREPMHVAADAATLDILAPGRVVLGMGAGHTYREWSDVGRSRPRPHDRAGRLVEFVEVVVRLLHGERVSFAGQYLHLQDARLEDLPVGPGRIGLVVGGGHPEVLRVAAARADVVALSGLGRTLADGHRHEVRWSQRDLDRQLQLVRAEAQRTGTAPELEALVHVVTDTADRDGAVAELSDRLPGTTPTDVAATPFVLIGTAAQMATQMLRQARELNITRYVVREPAVAQMEAVLPLLRRGFY